MTQVQAILAVLLSVERQTGDGVLYLARERLAVLAWQAFPERFGVRRIEESYPCTATVSAKLSLARQLGLVELAADSLIGLTNKGRREAEKYIHEPRRDIVGADAAARDAAARDAAAAELRGAAEHPGASDDAGRLRGGCSAPAEREPGAVAPRGEGDAPEAAPEIVGAGAPAAREARAEAVEPAAPKRGKAARGKPPERFADASSVARPTGGVDDDALVWMLAALAGISTPRGHEIAADVMRKFREVAERDVTVRNNLLLRSVYEKLRAALFTELLRRKVPFHTAQAAVAVHHFFRV